jgi:hypothetical protein
MISAVQRKYSVKLQTRISLGNHGSVGSIRPKYDLGVLAAFENFFVHPPVSTVVTALTRGRIHYDLAAGLPRCGIDG